MGKSRKVLKWVALFFVSSFALLFLAILAVPLFVDVDRFRPQIVDAAAPYLNGKLSLGKLSLSMWGQVKVRVEGFELADASGAKVVSAKDVDFHVPFSSILVGAPSLTFSLRKPDLFVVKNKAGLNVLSLVKAGASPAPASPPSTSAKPPGWLIAAAARARLGLELLEATLVYTDKLTDLVSKTEALNVRVKDLSLSRPVQVEVSATLDTKMAKILSVKGPILLSMQATPKLRGSDFERIDASFKADFDRLEVSYGALFHKKAGVPMNAEGTLSATPLLAEIRSLVLRFHNAELKGSAKAEDFQNPNLGLTLASNDVAMGPWSQLVPLLGAYELQGSASFSANAAGRMDQLKYDAEFLLKSLRAKAPMLKSQPTINASVRVVTDKVERVQFSFAAPGNDLRVAGTVQSFSKPKADFRIDSTGMDLDQLVEFPKATKEAAAPTPASDPKASPSKASMDFDALLDPLRTNPIAAATVLKAVVAMKFVKVMGAKVEGIDGTFSFAGLAANLEKLRLSVFGGSVVSNALFSLKPKVPTYRFGVDVAGLDLKQAVASQFALFKDTLLGKASFKMSGSGMSFNPEPAKENLQASGSMNVTEAVFTTLDVGKMAGEAVNKAIAGLESKLPQLRGKRIGSPGGAQTGYDRVASTFTVAKGVFSMPDFVAISGGHKGIDIKGATTIGLKDFKLAANWELIDTHNITGAKTVSIEVGGVKVDPLLAEPGQPVRFPIALSGTVFAPVPSYTSVIEHFAKVAMANAGRAAADKAKAEVKARVDAEIQKAAGQAAPAIQNAIQDLGKRFKF
jgi:hypothetical protein